MYPQILASSHGNQRGPLPSTQGRSAADEPSARPKQQHDLRGAASTC